MVDHHRLRESQPIRAFVPWALASATDASTGDVERILMVIVRVAAVATMLVTGVAAMSVPGAAAPGDVVAVATALVGPVSSMLVSTSGRVVLAAGGSLVGLMSPTDLRLDPTFGNGGVSEPATAGLSWADR